jgi:predicted MFS family arabinose efflux permease
MGTFTAAFELGLGGGAILFGMLLARTNYTTTFLGTAAAAMTGFIIFVAGQNKRKNGT